MESVVALTLRQEQSEHSLVDFALFVHGKVSRINDKCGEHLEISH